MMLKDLKFTETELGDKDISSLPDRPGDAGITTEELKARFDMIPKTLLALGKFNQMIDELGATEEGNSGADNIGVSPVVGASGGTLQAVLGEMGDLTQAAKQAGEIAAAQGAAAVTAADNATAAANAATEKAANAESAAEIATSQGKEAAAAATAATAAIIEVKDYAAEQAQSAKDYVDQVILEGGVVSSVFGRAGIVAAEAGDYTAEQITYGDITAAEGIAAAQRTADTANETAEIALWAADAAQKTADAKSNENLFGNWYFADLIDQRGGYIVPKGVNYYIPDGAQNFPLAGTTTESYTVTRIDSAGSAFITIDGTEYFVPNGEYVRGYTGAGYTIDRWMIGNNCALFILEKLIRFERTAESYSPAITHFFDGKLTGKFTASFLYRTQRTTGVFLFSITDDNGERYQTAIPDSNEWNLFTLTFDAVNLNNIHLAQLMSGTAIGNYIDIRAAKLELGDKQTLARKDANGNWVLNDPPPNKLIQLLKCQYFYRLFATESARPKALADYHPPMRVNPATGTIDINGVTYYYADANL